MDNVASARINNFGPALKVDVQPAEESVFVLTSSQLREIIAQAVKEAIQPLQDRIESLENRMSELQSKVASQESLQESEVSRICVDIATDRRRLAALEKVELQPMQKDRGEILRALIAANGGKMLAMEARQKMHLSKELFSMLLASMKDHIEKKPLHSDRRKLVIYIKD